MPVCCIFDGLSRAPSTSMLDERFSLLVRIRFYDTLIYHLKIGFFLGKSTNRAWLETGTSYIFFWYLELVSLNF